MPSSQSEIFVRALSRLLGWIYMASWSASFYPQPIYNFQRGSTAGLSIDFPTINFLGFVCYAIYTAAFLYSPVIRAQYAARHPHSGEPTVRFNDFAFAAHAVVLSAIVYSQFWPVIWGLRVSRFQRISKPMAGLFWGSILAVLVVIGIVMSGSPDRGNDPSSWAWIDVVSNCPLQGAPTAGKELFQRETHAGTLYQIYTFSYIKLVITVVKYVPQAWLNYKRQSTVGWSIVPILMDLTGGVLSLVQLVLDSSLQSDWSGITGNPVKFLLGNITIVSDMVFVVQHYILYRDASEPKSLFDPDPNTPLLVDSHAPRQSP
ncbi:L-cystine transporter [Penicillium hispanicum]|uniref:L-cystine transporter n=1 Tax=Penicillium hispanicum TaxID=1080232 RepID=UPI00254130BD|nr:L-cystine transporter [Penicillium hispanicum]KAJ5573402.1 L-cystine transporter [Penicillium hispanicum]